MENIKRSDRLRQIKTSISGSEKHLIVGIDIAKNKHYAFFDRMYPDFVGQLKYQSP